MRRHTKLISPQKTRAKTTDLGLKGHSKLSGSHFFEEGICGAEDEDDQDDGEDKNDADMEVAVEVNRAGSEPTGANPDQTESLRGPKLRDHQLVLRT